MGGWGRVVWWRVGWLGGVGGGGPGGVGDSGLAVKGKAIHRCLVRPFETDVTTFWPWRNFPSGSALLQRRACTRVTQREQNGSNDRQHTQQHGTVHQSESDDEVPA